MSNFVEPSPSRVYRIGKSTRTGFLRGAVVYIGLFILTLVFSIIAPGTKQWLGLITAMSCVFAAVYIVEWWKSKRVVVVDDYAIKSVHPGKPDVSLRWQEIATIRDRPLMQRLVLGDGGGQREIHLGYHLENLHELLEILLAKAINRITPRQAPAVFHGSAFLLVVLAMSTAVAGLVALDNKILAISFWLVLAFFTVNGILKQPLIVRVLESELILQFPLSKKSIRLTKVSDVKLQHIPNRSPRLRVVIETSGAQPVILEALREGSMSFYETLRNAWQAASN